MYQGDRPGLTEKINLVAQRQRLSLGRLATDVVGRSAFAALGDIVTGHGPNDPQPVPLGGEGSVLTAAPGEAGGVRWAAGAGAETDSDANGNVWEGPDALPNVGTGTGNTAVGNGALQFQTDNNESTAVGYQAINFGASYDKSTSLGARAEAVTGAVAIGWNAEASNLYSVAAGYQALGTGGAAVAVGYKARTQGDGCIAIGSQAFAQTDGVAMGTDAYAFNSSVAIGSDALNAGHFGGFNTAVGARALHTSSVGVGNTAIGYNAGGAVSDAFLVTSYTTAVGYNAQATGSGGVAIGADHLGNGAAAGNDSIVLGTANHTTTIPGLPAFVAGDKYLVVDGSGNIHKSALGPAS